MRWLRIETGLFVLAFCSHAVAAFVPPGSICTTTTSVGFASPKLRVASVDQVLVPVYIQQLRQRQPSTPKKSCTSLNMFMGSDGGILGVGAPEVFTILLVGYFVLGPSDLYKVVKEIGKFVQNFRTLGSDLSKTVESSFESQLELEEIRKAQRELTDAFSFRRTINVDEEGQAFSTPATSSSSEEAEVAVEAGAAAAVATGGKKKKIRKRLKKRIVPQQEEPTMEPEMTTTMTAEPPAGVVEDLDMTSAFTDNEPEIQTTSPQEDSSLREERMERLKQSDSDDNWYDESLAPDMSLQEQERFATQMSENWNAQILANEDKLSPLAKVMERLAILEEEKNAADARLEEEFRLRTDLEEKYYKEKRELLEEAAAQVQADAYTNLGGVENENNNSTTVEA